MGTFIGCTQPLIWIDDLTQDNQSSQRIRRFYGYELLINSRPMAWLRKNLIPQALRNRIKQAINYAAAATDIDVQREHITEIFDRDLKVVGDWLGIELTCDNFKQGFRKD